MKFNEICFLQESNLLLKSDEMVKMCTLCKDFRFKLASLVNMRCGKRVTQSAIKQRKTFNLKKLLAISIDSMQFQQHPTFNTASSKSIVKSTSFANYLNLNGMVLVYSMLINHLHEQWTHLLHVQICVSPHSQIFITFIISTEILPSNDEFSSFKAHFIHSIYGFKTDYAFNSKPTIQPDSI